MRVIIVSRMSCDRGPRNIPTLLIPVGGIDHRRSRRLLRYRPLAEVANWSLRRRHERSAASVICGLTQPSQAGPTGEDQERLWDLPVRQIETERSAETPAPTKYQDPNPPRIPEVAMKPLRIYPSNKDNLKPNVPVRPISE